MDDAGSRCNTNAPRHNHENQQKKQQTHRNNSG